MKLVKIIFVSFILIFGFLFLYESVNVSKDKVCSKETMNLFDSIHTGMNVDESIRILQQNKTPYSTWKDGVEIKIDSMDTLPQLFEIVAVAESKSGLFTGRKELIIIEFAQGRVSERNCKVVLVGL